MRKTLLSSVTSLLLPLAAYGATPTYGSYQRSNTSRADLISALPIPSGPSQFTEPSTITGAKELSVVQGAKTRELIIVDASVRDKHLIMKQSRPGIEVVEIKATEQGGLAALTQALKGYNGLDAVHIVAHAEAGVLYIGGHKIDQQQLTEEASAFSSINSAIREGGDFMLYGCDLAKGPDGEAFLDILQENTHVDIAASKDLTGNPENGGDWDLEIKKGSIETALLSESIALRDFRSVLQASPGTKDFSSGWTDTGNTLISTNFVVGAKDASSSSSLDVSVYAGPPNPAYALNAQSVNNYFYVNADGTNTGSFELTGLTSAEYGLGQFTNVYIVGVLVGGGQVTSSTINGTGATNESFNFGSGELASFSGEQLTGFKLYFESTTNSEDVPFFEFRTFTTGASQGADSSPPVVQSIALSGTPNANASSVDFNVTFDESANNLSSDDFALTTTGSASGVIDTVSASSGTSVTVTVNGISGEGTLRLDLPSGTNITDNSGNSGVSAYTSGNEHTVDRVAPSAPSAPDLNAASDTGNSSTDNLTSETTPALSGTAEANSTVVITSDQDGTVASTTADGSGNWTATASTLTEAAHALTATAEDSAGNQSSPSGALTVTVDTSTSTPSAPDLSAASDSGTSSTDNLTADTTPTLAGTAEANSTVQIISDQDGSLGTTTADGSGNWTFTTGSAISATTHSLTANATDVAGNVSGSSSALNVTIDNVTPSVSSVNVPANSTYIEGDFLDFTVNTDESVTVDTGGGAPQIAITVGSTTRHATYISGSGTSSLVFRHTVQSGDEDADGITVVASLDTNGGSLKDSAGNDLSTALNNIGTTAGIIVDALAPSGHSVSFDDATLSGTEASSTSFTFASAEVGADYTYTISSSEGGTSVSSSGTVTTTDEQITGIDVSGLPDGTLTLSVTLTDTAGNTASAVTDTATLDATSPTTSLSTAASDPTNGAFSITVTFGETVSGFDIGDITVTNADLSNFSGSGSSYTATVTPTADGSVSVDIAADVVQDSVGNGNTAATTLSLTYDGTAPSPTITSAEPSPSNSTSFTATVNFGETVTGFAVGDISAGNASLSGFTDNGDGSFDMTVTPSAEGTVTLDIGAGAAQDTAGNNSEAASQFSLDYDGTLPTLSGTSPTDGATNVPYDADIQLTFDEAIVAQPGSDAVVEIFDDADNQVDSVAVTSSNASVSGNTATIDFVAELVPTMSYYVQVSGTAFADSASNLFGGIADKTTLNFTVANTSPTANNDAVSVNEEQSVDITVLGNDVDPDSTLNSASVQVGTAPSNGSTSVDTGSGVITYTPNADFAGTDTFTYTVDDVHGGTSNEATVTVTVNNVNDAPTANDDTANTPEDNPISIDVAADDSDIDSGDSVDPSTIVITSEPANGSAELVSGEVLYTPDTDFSGTDQFSYTIEDQNGDVSNVATVIINVNGVNDTPTALDDSASVDEDNPVDVDVTANDSDVDGTVNATTVQVLDDVANGTLSVDATTGVVTYTPDENFNGTDTFTYVVQDDADGTSNEATVTLTVNSINDAPVADDNAATLQEETPHEINVLGNDSDVDGSLDIASVEIVSAPSDGATTIDTTTGAITYTPEENFDGNDSFTYRVMDNEGLWSNAATVNLTVEGVNDAPLANDDDATTEEDTPATIDLLTNDNDVDGTVDATSIALSSPSNGSADLNGDGTVTYTPDEHFNGADSFSYTVNDDMGEPSNTATVSVTVTPVNDAPTISGTPTASVNEREAYSFTPIADDVDANETLSFSVTGLPAWAEFDNTTGTLTGTPGISAAGNYPGIVISVSDGDATTDLTAFSIQVMDVNNAPTIGGTAPTTATVGQAYTFAPTATDPDATDTLSYSATGLPEWLTLDSATGELSGTPADDDVGNYTGLQVSVSDGTATDTLGAFSLTVEPGVDSDNDSFSDYQEGLDGTDPNDPASYLDLMPPQLAAPAAQVLDADALFTRITLRQLLGLANDATEAELQAALNPLASDNIDGNACCNPRVMGMEGNTLRLAPGRHEITWLAEDRQNNSAEATQVVNIRPLVSLSKDQVAVAGNTVELSVVLNGRSPFYPLTIPYRVASESTADSEAHDLTDGTLVLEEGERRKTLSITLAPNDGGSDSTLIVALDDRTPNAQDLAEGYDENDPNIYDINSGAKTRHRIEIVSGNVAPRVNLQLVQNEERRLLIPRAGGAVRATAVVTDPNTGDSHQYDWSATDSTLIDTDEDTGNETLVFEPQALNPGRYRVAATVTDSAGATTEVSRHFVVVPAPPTLNPDLDSDDDGIDDATEGFADENGNGIPNYQDSLASTNVLLESAERQNAFLMECDPGVACGLGEFSLQTGKGGTELGEETVGEGNPIPGDVPFEPVGGIFDFEMTELPELGQSVSVVIPQREPIPADAVYRKFLGGEWVTFVEDADNRLQSADGEPGYCPPVGSNEWEDGLTEGHHCVQLTLEDGGPNDADGLVNGSVSDPGAVSRPVEQEPEQPGTGTPEYDGEVTTRSSGGGGSNGALFTGLLLSLGLGRRWVARRARKRRRVLAWLPMLALGSLLLPSPQASAQAPGTPIFEQLQFELGLYRAKSSTSAADFTRSMSDRGVPITLSRYDIDRQALSFELGLPLAPHFRLGVGYLNLGDVTADFQVDGATAQALSQGLTQHYPYSTTGWTVSSQLKVPLAERIAVTAEVGLYRWESETRSLGPNLPAQSRDGVDPMLGAGFELPLNERVTAGFRFRQVLLKDQTVDLMGLTLRWQY
ncbi:tandem-95 repeat protein [Marinimicrobium agarilyticum]|uniref:tandem-95 repeat protein n=1 Tax=Marinimicrobium agarilyticum TaxID=306546 RepID=UPI000488B38F|nr:tandem-95 repeat protein [Marinimicrobium agarilyticum]